MKWKIKIKICFGLLLNRRMKRDRDSEKIAWNNSHEYLIALNLVERARDKKKKATRRGKTNKIARYQIILKITYRLCNDHICICPHTQCNNIFVSLCAITIFFLFLFTLLFCFFFFRVWLSIFAHIHGNGNGSKEVCN